MESANSETIQALVPEQYVKISDLEDVALKEHGERTYGVQYYSVSLSLWRRHPIISL